MISICFLDISLFITRLYLFTTCTLCANTRECMNDRLMFVVFRYAYILILYKFLSIFTFLCFCMTKPETYRPRKPKRKLVPEKSTFSISPPTHTHPNFTPKIYIKDMHLRTESKKKLNFTWFFKIFCWHC